MAQVNTGNYPVPNDTGANVLADINENLAAVNSNNSGSNEPTIKLAHQFFVDESTTPDTLKIRDASNASYISLGKLETDLGHMPKTGGIFTGSLSLPSGSSSTPSLQLNDADTGLYLFASNNIGITTGGTLRLNIDSNGLTVNAGKELRLKDPQDNNYIAIKSPALSADLTFTLPNNDGNSGDKLESDGNGNLSWQPVQGVPTGSVHVMATTNVPSGYLECAGQSLSRTTYANLFAVITTTWGSASSSTFNLPDLRGQFVRGWANTRTNSNDTGRSFANAQLSRNKQHNHTITSTVNDSGHNHSVSYAVRNYYQEPNNMGVGTDASANSSDNTSSSTTGISVSSSASNSGSADARPDNVAMMYVIKT